ncbi:MAG: 1,4-dihydroxy-2-naphthoyl-CoA hydrolase [Rhodocyclaceae bacterium]|nr:1,4-dihydroxy-2-naphthoyl-CoA hydrolase [Rhodocyclaceae bacterium]MCK6383015.1 acyl-CoA thioesterase [Rhodocyclaceae bacterium]CAG0944353.1 4-hydroxybenzoyl-CoA thioesterase [Gammaproteobacteria bacterium]
MSSRILGDTFHSDMLVRFSHCDPAGIVFYPQYFIMFNGLVEDWFNQGLGVNYARTITEHRLGFPIVKLECDFVAPSKIGEIITLGLRLLRLGRSSMEIAVDCRHGAQARLSARFVLVAMDLERQRAQPVPDDLRALMLAFRNGEFDINNHNRRET